MPNLLKQAYEIKGSTRPKQITYQYEPIADTLVLIIMERVTSSKKQTKWVTQQIAGPWGNTALPDELTGTHIDDLKAAQSEARNLSRYLEADLGFENYWKAKTV